MIALVIFVNHSVNKSTQLYLLRGKQLRGVKSTETRPKFPMKQEKLHNHLEETADTTRFLRLRLHGARGIFAGV